MKYHPSIIFLFIIIGIFICGCTEKPQQIDKGKLIGSWQNKEDKSVTISFPNESVVSVSRSFGCWFIDKMEKQPADFNCEFFEIHRGVWNHSDMGSRNIRISIFNIEIENKTYQNNPNTYYAIINGTVYGTCLNGINECYTPLDMTLVFEYNSTTDSLVSSQFLPFNFNRISASSPQVPIIYISPEPTSDLLQNSIDDRKFVEAAEICYNNTPKITNISTHVAFTSCMQKTPKPTSGCAGTYRYYALQFTKDDLTTEGYFRMTYNVHIVRDYFYNNCEGFFGTYEGDF